MCVRSPTWVAKYIAGTGMVVPASPPLPPEIGRPCASVAVPLNLVLKLMPVTSAWMTLPLSNDMAAGLFTITEASSPAAAEPAKARPSAAALFSLSWKALACAAWGATSAPAMASERAAMASGRVLRFSFDMRCGSCFCSALGRRHVRGKPKIYPFSYARLTIWGGTLDDLTRNLQVLMQQSCNGGGLQHCRGAASFGRVVSRIAARLPSCTATSTPACANPTPTSG